MRERLARLHDAHNGRLDLVRAVLLDFGARRRQLRRLLLLRRHAADAYLVELGPELAVERVDRVVRRRRLVRLDEHRVLGARQREQVALHVARLRSAGVASARRRRRRRRTEMAVSWTSSRTDADWRALNWTKSAIW